MITTATNKKVGELITAIGAKTLIPNPSFQRRLVWSNKHKVAFLDTVLNNYPFPEIYIAAGDIDTTTGEVKLQLVDGQQRLTTLYEYFKGSEDLNLPKTMPAYAELSNDNQKAYLAYSVVVRDLGQVTTEQLQEVFRRINSTKYSLNAMEIHNARYEGEFKEFGEEIAALDFFESHNVFSGADVKRMNDTRFVLTAAISIMSNYFHRDADLEEYLSNYNDEFEKRGQLTTEFKQTLDFIEACNFPSNSRAWQKADLLNLIVEIHRALFKKGLKMTPELVRNSVMILYDMISNHHVYKDGNALDKDYASAITDAVNDRSNRMKRGEAISKRIEESVTI